MDLDEWTGASIDNPKPTYPFNFFEVGGITKDDVYKTLCPQQFASNSK